MQAHRRVGGLPIDTTLLTLVGVVFEKNKNFPKRLKNLIKTRSHIKQELLLSNRIFNYSTRNFEFICIKYPQTSSSIRKKMIKNNILFEKNYGRKFLYHLNKNMQLFLSDWCYILIAIWTKTFCYSYLRFCVIFICLKHLAPHNSVHWVKKEMSTITVNSVQQNCFLPE